MINLHSKSQKYIEKIFSKYKDADFNGFILELDNCILHLYAIQDSYNEQGELEGYIDALLFKVDIYDTINMKKYSHKFHDSIYFEKNSPHPIIKIFKDGSTLLHFRQKINMVFTSTITIQ